MAQEDLTTHRARIIDSSLPIDTKETLLNFLNKEIGYPAPFDLLDEMRNQDDKDSVISDFVDFDRAVLYHETWHKGAGYSSSSLDMKGLCLHHTAGTILGTIDHLTTKTRSASYHCMIGEDGNRYRFVDDRRRAFHAGFGEVKGRNPNHVLLSVSFNGDTVSGKFRKSKDATEHEIKSIIEFLKPRWDKFDDFWSWSGTHKEFDPKRRNDVSDSFKDQIFSAIEKHFGR